MERLCRPGIDCRVRFFMQSAHFLLTLADSCRVLAVERFDWIPAHSGTTQVDDTEQATEGHKQVRSHATGNVEKLVT